MRCSAAGSYFRCEHADEMVHVSIFISLEDSFEMFLTVPDRNVYNDTVIHESFPATVTIRVDEEPVLTYIGKGYGNAGRIGVRGSLLYQRRKSDAAENYTRPF